MTCKTLFHSLQKVIRLPKHHMAPGYIARHANYTPVAVKYVYKLWQLLLTNILGGSYAQHAVACSDIEMQSFLICFYKKPYIKGC